MGEMNGFILLIPFLLVRFGLIRVIDRQAVVRAAYFPPRIEAERAAYMIYQLANAVVLIGLLFFSVRMERSWLCGTGAACYLLGLLLCIASVIDFAAPSDSGFHENVAAGMLCISFCDFLPLDHPVRGAVVHPGLRRALSGVHEACQAIFLTALWKRMHAKDWLPNAFALCYNKSQQKGEVS